MCSEAVLIHRDKQLCDWPVEELVLTFYREQFSVVGDTVICVI